MLNDDRLFPLVLSLNLNCLSALLLLLLEKMQKTKRFIKLLSDKDWTKKKNCSILKLRCLRPLIPGKISIDQENLDTSTKSTLDTSGISKSPLAMNPHSFKSILIFFLRFRYNQTHYELVPCLDRSSAFLLREHLLTVPYFQIVPITLLPKSFKDINSTFSTQILSINLKLLRIVSSRRKVMMIHVFS